MIPTDCWKCNDAFKIICLLTYIFYILVLVTNTVLEPERYWKFCQRWNVFTNLVHSFHITNLVHSFHITTPLYFLFLQTIITYYAAEPFTRVIKRSFNIPRRFSSPFMSNFRPWATRGCSKSLLKIRVLIAWSWPQVVSIEPDKSAINSYQTTSGPLFSLFY